MSSRSDATQMIAPIEIDPVECPRKVSSYFGVNTFNENAMKSMVSEETFTAFKKWQNDEIVITPKQADEIADAMKEWAVARGATSYTHWFQPMTGTTAEKHDGFLTVNGTGQVIERFTGSKLIQGEPDASSFPSGGLRATFEARGYTAWDPSSPAFISEVELGKTLCIPTIFISYTGEALDKKLPLLRSDDAINRAAVELLKVFGSSATKVASTCGPEQEYFLIDESYARLRPDIQLTGRTLIGAASPKGQQLEDQYFGSIKERMLNYMNEVAQEAYKLGIPVTTRHNEVAPHQFEFAPYFERANLAADHNQLLMDIMKKVAKRHSLECLVHEKPFAGINGSGKHLNWSLADDLGNNLLNPGDTPEENLQFLAILVAIANAVYKHADLLRAAVASAGNEHRLGANEAPPAIVSIFLGRQLSSIVASIQSGKMAKVSRKDFVDLGLRHLPTFARDNTDRNRTSPFAFTGAKFEFRALGSALNISTPIAVINTIVADSLKDITARIKKATKGQSFEKGVFAVLQEALKECAPIFFEGDNYCDKWVTEAEKRGLANIPSSPEALKAFVKPENIRLFERHKVLNKSELSARYNIWLDIYNKVLEIESHTLSEMVSTQVIPSAYEFQSSVAQGLLVLKECADTIGTDVIADREATLRNLSNHILYVNKNMAGLNTMMEKAESMDEVRRADFFFSSIKPQLLHIRKHVDELEILLPDELWLLPKYREMLFIS